MENKKEPLMGYEDWDKQNKYTTLREHIKAYANYHTQWHLNNAKEFVANEAKVHQHSRDYKVGAIGKIVRQKIMISEVHKQSIHTAIDNYIKENL